MRVFANCAISLDGRLTSAARERVMLGSDEDRRRMAAFRAQADAILVGGQTFRTWGLPLVERPERLAGPPPVRGRPLVNAVLTRRGLTGRPWPRFPDPRVAVHVFGLPSLDAQAHRDALGATVHATAHPTPGWALSILADLGYEAVLVEGGGGLLAPLLQEERLDELAVTVCPVLLGGDAPSLVDGPGFLAAAAPRLQLLSHEVVGSEVFLRYRVRTKRATASV